MSWASFDMDPGLIPAESEEQRAGETGDVVSSPYPDAEAIADVLGLRPTSPPALSEYRRRSILVELMMPRLRLETDAYQCQVLTRFCLSYLPTFLDSVLDPPVPTYDNPDFNTGDYRHEGYSVGNAFSVMFRTIVANPYFLKFLCSSHPAALTRVPRLPEFYARHVIALFERFSRDLLTQKNVPFQEGARNEIRHFVANFFTFLINIGSPYTLPDDVTRSLLRHLIEWPRQFPCIENPWYDDTFRMVSLIVLGKPLVGPLERRMEQSVQRLCRCAKAGCGIEHDLYICGRCGTEVYCSREHQRFRWSDPDMPHKDLCFETIY